MFSFLKKIKEDFEYKNFIYYYKTDRGQFHDNFRNFYTINQYKDYKTAYLDYRKATNENEKYEKGARAYGIKNITLYNELSKKYIRAKRIYSASVNYCKKAEENNIPYNHEKLKDSCNNFLEARREFSSAFPNTYWYTDVER